MTPHRLTLIHPLDPRTPSCGVGLRMQRIMAGRPDDFSILFVGVDETGDLPIGRPATLAIEGRAYEFLPLLGAPHGPWPPHDDRRSRHGLAFRLAFLRRLKLLREAAEAERASTELHDFAWAPLARLIGRPVVQVVESDAAIAARANAIEEVLALRFATRIVGDEDSIGRLRHAGGSVAAKTEVLRLTDTIAGGDREVCPQMQIQRLYERHRRLYRVGRAGMVRHAVA